MIYSGTRLVSSMLGAEFKLIMTSKIEIHRLYQSIGATQGYRVFIDRLWPRGVSKDEFKYDVWCKDLAPSPALRKWFGHKEKNWLTFCERYRAELRSPEQQERMNDLLERAGAKRIILLYGAKDPDHNHAIVLAQELKRTRQEK